MVTTMFMNIFVEKMRMVNGKPKWGNLLDGVGFVPNDSYNWVQDNTTLEYGQYALAFANSKDTLDKLLQIFNSPDAYQIYFMVLFHDDRNIL